MKFFENFPVIRYNGVPCRNLMARVAVPRSLKNNWSLFYPYTMEEGQRLDNLAASYFNDMHDSWIIALSNDIQDTLLDTYQPLNQLQKRIEHTFGSVANSMDKIVCYRNNFLSDNSQIAIQTYNAYPASVRKYWSPNTDQFNQVVSYRRKAADWKISTNMIVLIVPRETQPNYDLPKKGDVVRQTNGFTATVVSATRAAIVVQHVNGNLDFGLPLNGIEIDSMTILSQALPPEEMVYWEPVSAYDIILEQNEANKQIALLNSSNLPQAHRALKDSLKK